MTTFRPLYLTVSRRTILLVDDSQKIRPLVRAILSSLENCDVLEAASAEDALEVASTLKSEIDLLLADISLPGKSGIALAEELRERDPGLKVLFMSGFSLPASTESGDPCIEKPFRPDALLSKVSQILNS